MIGSNERFDVVVLTGSVPVLPQTYFEMLNPGGRLFAVIGDAPMMEASIVTCNQDSSRVSRHIFETIVDPLINAPQPERFVF